MRELKHALQQPFIFATGLSAGIHSAWALGTMFSGRMPAADLTGEFIFWIVPAVLIAFAIDIGQIATSAEIREGQRSKSKYGTFIVLALATYYLQFIYIVHHMPAMQIAPGVALFPQLAELVRNAAVWVIPALLPISTILYTMGNESQSAESANFEGTAIDNKLLVAGAEQQSDQAHFIECDTCEWFGEYSTRLGAANALKAHRQHNHPEPTLSSNGNTR